MKKLLKALLTLALVITCICAVSVQTKAATVASGTCGANGGNLTWSLDDAGTLTISGSGPMKNYNESPWGNNCENIKRVVIKSGVTTVGHVAFDNCTELTSVAIPNSVASIGINAFSQCLKLTEIEVPNGVLSIQDWAFYGCSALKKASIPASVINIGRGAFAGCTTLNEISVSGSNANYSSDAKGVLYDKEKTILIQAPGNISGSYSIPESVTEIKGAAFSECKNLTQVAVPAGVTSIGSQAFALCDNLSAINVDKNNATYSSDAKGVLFDKEKTRLIQAPGGMSGSYTIPSSISRIDEGVFCGCAKLNAVTIPDSVTSIGYEAFSYCSGLKSLSIGKNVTYIDYRAFTYCTGLNSVAIGEKVTMLGEHAFAYCDKLTSVYIPKSVTSIYYGAFASCNSLKEVCYGGNSTQWSLVEIEDVNEPLTKATLYVNCSGLPSFPDVKPNAWYYNAVEFAVEKGYFSGHDSGVFAPSDQITRQDFVLVLSRIAGADLDNDPHYTGVTAFADVPCSASYTPYYAKAIQWATENGIINGYDPDINGVVRFGVGDKLTREQLVTIMYRYAKKLGVDVTITTGWDLMATYPDAIAPNPDMKEMVAWALENGVISGKQVNGKTCIAPQASATRAETAQILMNISTKGIIPGI